MKLFIPIVEVRTLRDGVRGGACGLGDHDTVKTGFPRNTTFSSSGAPAMRQNDFSDNIRSKEALHLPHVEPRAMVEGIEKPQVDRYNAI